ncbi:MAG: hypothetical protein EA358_09520 [Flavobacteriales bacterium]|nr:MAG: hypothetical protein EA358_09520 [Flavobacteriales bacterium]
MSAIRIFTLLFLLVLTSEIQAQRPPGKDREEWQDDMEKQFELYVRNVRYQRDHLPWADLHFGPASLAAAPLAFGSNSDILPTELGRSWMWKFGAGMQYRWDKTPMVLQYGLRFSVHRLGLPDGRMVFASADGGYEYGIVNPEYSRVQLVASYLNIPLMLHFDYSKYGIGNGFTWGFGGEFGIRTNQYQRYTMPNAQGDDLRVKVSGPHGISPIRYGLLTQLGYKAYKISVGYDLNSFVDLENNAHFVYFLLGIEL